MKLRLAHLYPRRMNIYGDRGNIMSLARRAEWRGITLVVDEVEAGAKTDVSNHDLFFFGGGQDQQQGPVARDLQARADDLKAALAAGAALLAVCGGYQLLGRYYQPAVRAAENSAETPERLAGLGVFPAYTEAGSRRLIGNVVAAPALPELGRQPLVGFENHSGLTRLDEGAQALAQARTGFGNNGEDGTEGCVAGNAVGTYLHGSLLPKNPHLADWLLRKALLKHGPDARLEKLDDTMEDIANKIIVERFS